MVWAKIRTLIPLYRTPLSAFFGAKILFAADLSHDTEKSCSFSNKEINLLVQPPDNYYWSRFTDIHGISAKDTKNTPTFDQIWPQITPYIENQNAVAHNGFGFDFPVLDKTLEYYGMPTPVYNKFCTYKIYKSNLATLCQEHNILWCSFEHWCNLMIFVTSQSTTNPRHLKRLVRMIDRVL